MEKEIEKEKNFFNNGNLSFEGEYLKGKRWNGKGKEYDNTGNLIFEKIYLNGNINNKEKDENKNKIETKNI